MFVFVYETVSPSFLNLAVGRRSTCIEAPVNKPANLTGSCSTTSIPPPRHHGIEAVLHSGTGGPFGLA
jgi:hypothetical protein